MRDSVAVSLLGPVQVVRGGVPTPVAGVKLQSLLALLALAVPHVVLDDHLLEELWGDDQPTNPANALQALVSSLRRLLGRDTVARQVSGYTLRVDPDDVDAIRLERLVEQAQRDSARGDHASAAALFRSAVELVRGPPLAELVDRWFARDAATRLGEAVLAAQEGLIDAELALGRHADVVGRLLDLVRLHPLRERFRSQLVVALYRGGRQADALQAYRDARDYLLDELGLDPGPELRSLERSVLAQDPALTAPISVVSAIAVQATLPVALTSFVGRERELGALEDALERNRLVTLVGPAGVGKSRLALEFARRLVDARELWFVELAPLHDGAAVAETIAGAIGAPELPTQAGQEAATPSRRVVERLGIRDVVVVIDNCEHVTESAATIVLDLLRGCPNARVVATSREPLHIDGEQQMVVDPLDEVSASRLFVDRAQMVRPLIQPSPGNDDAIGALVRRLDCLPLVIELAAARTKTFPVAEITSRLTDRFQLLRGASQGTTSRHDGLEAAIAWSYDLLFDDERRTFRRLAVFHGGTTIEGAEYLCGPSAFEIASRLSDRSLLSADTSGPAVRLTMLESLREYGLARLADEGELEATRADHMAWCVDLATRISKGACGSDQLRWLRRLGDEHDNLRAALAYGIAHDADAALRLVAQLVRPWWTLGRVREVREWTEASLEAAGDVATAARARVLALSGLVAEPQTRRKEVSPAEVRGELEIAEARQREALAIDESRGDELAIAHDCSLLLTTLTRQASIGATPEPAEVATLLRRGAEVLDRTGDDFGSSVIRIADAMMAVTQGDLDRAEAQADAAAEITVRTGDRYSSSRLEYVRGLIADLRGDPHAAYRHVERSLRLVGELGIHHAVTAQARLLVPLADRSGQRGLAAQWRAFVEDSSADWTNFDGSVMAAARNHEGLTERTRGSFGRAAAAHRAALEWYRDANIAAGVAFSESCLGYLASQQGDVDAARRHHAAALAAAVDSDDIAALALAVEGRAAVAAHDGDWTLAARLLGAGRSQWASAPTSMPTHRADVEAITQSAREALGHETFELTSEAGGLLNQREVLASARSD